MNNYIFLYALTTNEKWSTGGMTTLIGLGMTFIMLILLIGMIHLLRVVLKNLEKLNPYIKEKLHKKKQNDIGQATGIEDVVTKHESEIDDNTSAVIEKAVRNYVIQTANDEKPHNKIKIVSIKEVTND